MRKIDLSKLEDFIYLLNESEIVFNKEYLTDKIKKSKKIG